uniref:RING-type domain-containing protein n=1 Tax=Mus spicilegus TaxID=10103 RepID=A0A8C6ICU4_MUSSI
LSTSISRRGATLNSRQTQKRTRETTSTPDVTLETEPIELMETVGDEIVDLACESLQPVVVDLTHNDSVVIVEERRRPRKNGRRFDDEALSRDKDMYVTTHTPRSTKDDGATGPRPSGVRSAWMDTLRLCRIGVSVSTECGHVFCSQCLRDSLKNANTCPTCRKKINHKQCHPIHI